MTDTAGLSFSETVQYTASLFAQSEPAADVLSRAGIAQLADRRVGKCSAESSSG